MKVSVILFSMVVAWASVSTEGTNFAFSEDLEEAEQEEEDLLYKSTADAEPDDEPDGEESLSLLQADPDPEQGMHLAEESASLLQASPDAKPGWHLAFSEDMEEAELEEEDLVYGTPAGKPERTAESMSLLQTVDGVGIPAAEAKQRETQLGLLQEGQAVQAADSMSAEQRELRKVVLHQAADSDFFNLNVTAPQLIRAGLEVALPSAFGQVNITLNRTTICTGGYHPTRLRTGHYTCHRPFETGNILTFLWKLSQLMYTFTNASRLVLLLVALVIAIIGTCMLEALYFRRRKGVPEYEVIGTELSEEHPADSLQEPLNSKGGDGAQDKDSILTDDSIADPSPERPSFLPPFEPSLEGQLLVRKPKATPSRMLALRLVALPLHLAVLPWRLAALPFRNAPCQRRRGRAHLPLHH
mmetsp:Transcript_66979/g.119105  ORF Transcript_66979/g.119105 Transcript_66979/m.119105 type:complete len:414 (-) Transcript_66979:37-1278(-)